MDSAAVLAELRRQFGDKALLTAADIAVMLGKSIDAVYALIARGTLPFPVQNGGGGRPAVSIFAAASILAGESPSPPKKAPKTAAPAVPPPKRKRESLGSLLRSADLHRQFFEELFAELEKIELATFSEESSSGDPFDGSL